MLTVTFADIRTDRLLLRPVRPADADALAGRRSDPAVAKYQSWTPPYPLERAVAMITSVAANDEPPIDDWWMLTIADSDDTTILGDLALRQSWDGRAAEIGYTLASDAWGHGYAVEAVAALVERLFGNDDLTRIHAMLHPDNVASAQVLERTGFLYEGRTRLSYWVGNENTDDLTYGMTRQDWIDWTTRRREPANEVSLIEITASNTREVRALATHKSQERLVATVAASFGDALFPAVVNGEPVVPWLRAIQADGDLVGFLMLGRATDRHPEPFLWRLLIDRRHQRRGIGRRALDLAIDECVSMDAASMVVSWCDGRGSPRPLYEARGFVPTGVLRDGEVEARLKLR